MLRILGLEVIAFDSNYNKLDPFETTTIVLYEELKKNSEFKNQSGVHHHPPVINQSTPGSAHSTSVLLAANNGDTSFSTGDTSLLHFYHKSAAVPSFTSNSDLGSRGIGHSGSGSISTSPRSSSTYCLQVSLYNLVPSPNCSPISDENCDLCVNLFLYKVAEIKPTCITRH